MGMTRDGEEALLWLSRAAKQLADALQSPLAASPAPPADAVANADGTGNASAGTGAAVPQLATAQGPQQRRPPPLLMSYQSCSDILAQVRMARRPAAWAAPPALPASLCCPLHTSSTRTIHAP
jgi:hypothetical protein